MLKTTNKEEATLVAELCRCYGKRVPEMSHAPVRLTNGTGFLRKKTRSQKALNLKNRIL